jgi:hypothetical protein
MVTTRVRPSRGVPDQRAGRRPVARLVAAAIGLVVAAAGGRHVLGKALETYLT